MFPPQLAAEETPVHDLLLILGDLNANAGTNNEGEESIIGKHGCGVIDSKGSRLEDLCQSSNTRKFANQHELHPMGTHRTKLTIN